MPGVDVVELGGAGTVRTAGGEVAARRARDGRTGRGVRIIQ